MTEPTTKTHIRDTVLKYITDRPGQIVYLTEIMAEIPNLKEGSVQAALHRVIRENSVPGLSINLPSRAWTYQPNASTQSVAKATPVEEKPVAKAKLMFAEIGKTKEGDFILECEDGDLYRATQL